jgi:hypothetical protein
MWGCGTVWLSGCAAGRRGSLRPLRFQPDAGAAAPCLHSARVVCADAAYAGDAPAFLRSFTRLQDGTYALPALRSAPPPTNPPRAPSQHTPPPMPQPGQPPSQQSSSAQRAADRPRAAAPEEQHTPQHGVETEQQDENMRAVDDEADDNRYARFKRVLPDRTSRVAAHLTENVFITFLILTLCWASCRNRLPDYFKPGKEGRCMKREPATPAAGVSLLIACGCLAIGLQDCADVGTLACRVIGLQGYRTRGSVDC